MGIYQCGWECLCCEGYGAKTGVRGTKEMGTRPRLAVLDDLVSDEDARSKLLLIVLRIL